MVNKDLSEIGDIDESKSPLQIMANVSRILNSSADIEDVFERFAEEAAKIIPFDRISINLFNSSLESFQVAYVSGIELSDRKIGTEFCLENVAIREAISNKQSYVYQPESPGDRPDTEITLDLGLQSLMSIPLISNDRLVGVMIFRSKYRNAYVSHDVEIAEGIGEQIAGTVANSSLRIALEQESRERELLADIGSILCSTRQIEGSYDLISEAIRKIVPFDRLSIWSIESDGDTGTCQYICGMELPECGYLFGQQ